MTDEAKPEWVVEMPRWADVAPHNDNDPRATDITALVTKRNAELAKVRAERDAALDELSSLSSYVGCGLGDEGTTLLEYIARVRDGIDSQGTVLVGVLNELTAARARIDELETERDAALADARAMVTSLDKLTFARDVLRVDVKEARASIATLETDLRLAREAAETAHVHMGVAEVRIAELEAAQQWRPMSEAPRDGTWISICLSGREVVPAMWGTFGNQFCRTDGFVCNFNEYGDAVEVWDYGALGWLPLPEPPKEGT